MKRIQETRPAHYSSGKILSCAQLAGAKYVFQFTFRGQKNKNVVCSSMKPVSKLTVEKKENAQLCVTTEHIL